MKTALRILLVDDDEDDFVLTRNLFGQLKDNSHQLDWIQTYDQALEAMTRDEHDAYLVDFQLGERNGLDLVRQAMAGGCQRPIILFTGYGERTVDEAALAAGVADFLVKRRLDAVTLERSIRYAIDRRQSQEQIRQQAALLDSAREAIYVIDLGGRIKYWNQGAERLYGWTSQEALGGQAEELLTGQQRLDDAALAAARDLFAEALAIGAESLREKPLSTILQATLETGMWSGEVSHVTKDGRRLDVECRTTLSPSGARPHQILVIDIDVTERKRLESQFLQAQRLESVGRLASGVAHDLNNVLGGVMISLECLGDEEDLKPEERRDLIQNLYKSVERGAGIVRQVLTFARGGGGERLPAHLGHLVKEVRQVLGRTIPKTIEIEVQVPNDLWMTAGDVTQLYQVLMNLSLNACDAMPHGGKLTIHCENIVIDEFYAQQHLSAEPGAFVRLKVEDTGDGIPREILDKVFDPFFTTKPLGKGTGLGLSTVLGIVKSHGGFLSIYSEPQHGTRFMLHFPVTDAPAGIIPPADEREVPAGNGELILIIDDERIFREMSKRTLERHGYRAVTANDGEEGLALFLQKSSDIRAVITDMRMPRADGASVIRHLRAVAPDLPIVVTSGLAVATADEIAGFRVQGILQKPYTANSMIRVLHEALATSSPMAIQN